MANSPLTLLVLEQSAHCDWDWLQKFEQYFTTGYGSGSAVKTILDNAIDYVANTSGYTYVFCEVGYLRRYFESNPSTLADWRAAIANGTFQFSSGGITSAENLLLHGEAFIRNYLLGRQWLRNTLGATASLRMWVPDDFGHDAQLPILLKALGYTGVGFWRIPVDGPQAPPTSAYIGDKNYSISVSPSAPSAFLVAGDTPIGVDFIWQAADQSSVQAHWLMNGYGEGDTDLGKDYDTPDPSGLSEAVTGDTSYANMTKSGIAFIPIDNDFSLPYQDLPSALAGWSLDGVTAQLSTFDAFLTQANTNLPTLFSNPTDGSNAYVPNPFWSGCYVSQPELKQFHYATVRTLLMTEAMEMFLEIIATFNSSFVSVAQAARQWIHAAWEATMPSTHHDYITGTAPTLSPENVYGEEQVPRLQDANLLAGDAARYVLDAVAAAINPGETSFGTPFAVFNATGHPSTRRLVEIDTDQASTFLSSTIDGVRYDPVQVIANGVLALADVLPFGYQTVWLTDAQPNVELTLSVTDNEDGSFTLANALLSAKVTVDGITELYDLAAGSGNLLSRTGNTLVYYEDMGSIYRFASEVPWLDGMSFKPVTAWSSLTISIAEEGDLRVAVEVTGTVNVSGEAGVPLTIVYALVANEPFLRITTSSAAPGQATIDSMGFSVMVSFPFGSAAAPITELAYGTTAHWDKRAPRHWYEWTPNPPVEEFDFMIFEPVHEYVIPYGANSQLGAVYPSSSPAWAISADGTSLYGCILRNTPNTAGNGAWGGDIDQHSISYAVRVPSGLGEPSTIGNNAPLVEALQLHNPLVAFPIPSNTTRQIPPYSALAVVQENDNALVTAVKAGTVDDSQMILRVYQPTNQPAPVTIFFPPLVANAYSPMTVQALTALEEAPADNVPIVGADNRAVEITMENAIATIALTRNM